MTQDGWLAFWRGNGAMLVHRFPYSGFTFLISDFCKEKLASLHERAFVPQRFHCLLSAGVGAACGLTFAYPLDVVRTRLSAQTKTLHYKGITEALFKIWQLEGYHGLYRGLGTSLSGAVPTVALNFAFYDMSLALMTDEEHPPTFQSLVAGGWAGAASSTLMFPVDLVRRHLQMDGLNGQPAIYSGFFDACRQIYHGGLMQQGFPHRAFGGIREFYRGLLPEVCKVTPNIAIMFTVREWLMLRQWPHEELVFHKSSR